MGNLASLEHTAAPSRYVTGYRLHSLAAGTAGLFTAQGLQNCPCLRFVHAPLPFFAPIDPLWQTTDKGKQSRLRFFGFQVSNRAGAPRKKSVLSDHARMKALSTCALSYMQPPRRHVRQLTRHAPFAHVERATAEARRTQDRVRLRAQQYNLLYTLTWREKQGSGDVPEKTSPDRDTQKKGMAA